MFPMKSIQAVNKMGLEITDINGIHIHWLHADDPRLNTYSITRRSHHHNFYEIHFVVAGTMRYSFAEGCAVVNAGQALLIPPKVKHRADEISGEFTRISAAFSIPEDNPLHASLMHMGTIMKTLNAAERTDLDNLILQAQADTVFTDRLAADRLFAILCSLGGEGLSRQKWQGKEPQQENRHLFRAKTFIDDNSDQFLNCRDVAGYCHLSEKQLGRIFRKYEDMTLLAYIHQRKVLQAQQLLRGNEPLWRVAQKLGFADEYYFNTFFSRYAGMTPNDYRRSGETRRS